MNSQYPGVGATESPSRYTSILELLIDPVYQLQLLWKHKWEIIGLVLISALLGALVASAVEPSYRATSSLMIQPQGAKVAPINDVYEHEGKPSDYILTRQEILRSRELAGVVVDKLKLVKHDYFRQEKSDTDSDLWASVKKKLPLVRKLAELAGDKESQSGVTPRDHAISVFRKSVRVEGVPFTFIVKIHAETNDRELSAKIANSLVDAYMRFDTGERTEITQQASGWLTKRLKELQANLEESEKELQQFYESEDLVNIGGARGLLTDAYGDNSEKLRDAHSKKVQLQSVYNKIRAAKGDLDKLQQIPYIQDKDLVQVAKRQYFQASETVSELSSRYGVKHPKMIAAKARQTEARAAFEKQLRLAADGVISEYQFANATEKSLSKAQSASRNQLSRLDRKQYTLERLQHAVQTNRQLFDSFLQRYKETDIASNLDNTNIRVVDIAVPPDEPFRPNKKLWVLGFTAFGFLISILLTFVRGYLDDTIKTAEAMEELTGVPVLAVLPVVKQLSDKAEKMARLELDDPGSAYAEAVRTLRTSVMLADASGKKKVILVASSVPAEGKSCVAANLAIAFGQSEKTLLIDCDLRRPSSAQYLSVTTNSVGLVDVLSGEIKVKDAIRHFDAGSIDLITCVKPPPNPSELLGSDRFKVLLERLSEYYDRIILDSPPCQVVSDAFLLANRSDAIIFLAKAESTYRRTVADAAERFRQTNGRMLGTVLNQVELKRGSRYGMYYYPEYYGGTRKA